MSILLLKTFKTQVTTNIRALIYLGLYGSETKRISHTEEQIRHVASQL